MDGRSQETFDALRRAHFPPERNHIPAHLTLFHKLPGAREADISADLERLCERQEPIVLRAGGPRSLGRGVAYRLESPRLKTLRRELAEGWWPLLGAQDRQGFSAHVTVQNKVSPETARATLEHLRQGFAAFDVTGRGLLLWRYLGGPWEAVGEYPFRG